jgi:hypothetical protein
MKEFANEIKKIIGLKSYNRFISGGSALNDLRMLINSGVVRYVNDLGKKVEIVESDSHRWFVIFTDFFIPIVNYYFSKDKEIIQKLITAFCNTWRSYKGSSLAFWALELDICFKGDSNDLLPFFPEPEQTILRHHIEYREKRAKEYKESQI